MPRVSVVMPVHDVAMFVREAVESVLAQTFVDFELIVVDDGSTDETAAVVQTIDDPRIRVVSIPHSGLARAENIGLEHATGEFVARVDGDDVVLPTLFERQVEVLETFPRTAVVGVWTRRFGAKRSLDRPPVDPKAIRRRLRRDWVLSQPVMYRAFSVREVGGFRPVWQEDWDLWVRLAERHELRVVPEYLGLIRARPASDSIPRSAVHSRRDKLQMRLLAFRRLGTDPLSLLMLAQGAASLGAWTVLSRFARRRPAAPPLSQPPRLSLVVPTYRRPELLARCLDAAHLQDPPPFEVIVVHRPEDGETGAFLREWREGDPDGRRTVEVATPGLVHALAAGTAEARGDVVAYLDDDAIPRPGWTAELSRSFLDPRVGAAGGSLLDHVAGRLLEGRTRRVGVVTWYGRILFGHNRRCDHYGEVDWLTGSNMAIRREVADHDRRLLHQSNGIAMANDLDVCLGVKRAGYRVVYSPWAAVEHHTTSFRDSVLGSRVAGGDVVSSSANHAYTLLKHIPWPRRLALHLYGYLVGSASLAGPIRILAEVPRSPRRAGAMARRMPLVWRGRRLGARMWREWREGSRPMPPATDERSPLSSMRSAS